MNKKTITGAGVPGGATPDEIVNSALEMLSVRAWPGPERNTRIEEYIMDQANAGRRTLSRKKLWLGGLMLLLCGSAIGAVTTRLATMRFTGTAVDSDGNHYTVEGELQVEGDEKEIFMSLEPAVEGAGIQVGDLTLEDGRKITIVPMPNGVTATLPADGKIDLGQTDAAKPKEAPKQPEQKKDEPKPEPK